MQIPLSWVISIGRQWWHKNATIGVILFLVGAFFLSISASRSRGDERAPLDWPCIQVYVPEVSPAIIWAGPDIGQLKPGEWRNTQGVLNFVLELTHRKTGEEQAERMIIDFAQNQSKADKNHHLTLAFAGVHEVLNTRRFGYMENIRKAARQQIRRADIVEATLLQHEELIERGSASFEEMSESAEKLELNQRIFDQRERMIAFLCEQPQEVESYLGALARMLANELE